MGVCFSICVEVPFNLLVSCQVCQQENFSFPILLSHFAIREPKDFLTDVLQWRDQITLFKKYLNTICNHFRFTVFFEPLTQRSLTEMSRKYVRTIAKCTLPQLQLSSERYSIARPISCRRPSNPPSECTEWIFSLSLLWNIMWVSMLSSPSLPPQSGPWWSPPSYQSGTVFSYAFANTFLVSYASTASLFAKPPRWSPKLIM